ncbi:hypothetical protein N7462_010830 [Penicillium macrosclerotiorum]|uniref:uncharacterized protein n=1 Tax=Penicillium macrosclerotiorum TaxID=303699 RepID=UPI002547BAAB|nr:uncharacterized protein N7462_010830 [Penicillium macrosclerotiorum]KAJ5669760.1 hypothetical protein N7462_010830 [Penicillium macrosclerotiorum]
MGESGIGRLWSRTQGLFTRRRYHGIGDGSQEDQVELFGAPTIHTQPSILSLASFRSFSSLPTAPQTSHSPFANPVLDEDETRLEGRSGHEPRQVTADSGSKFRTNDDPVSSREQKHWIDGVYICAKAGVLVLFINLVFIATSAGLASRYPDNASYSNAIVIYRGSCGVSKRWDIALHLIINVLSTCILAASNYCMQTLVAPTREEVDQQHAQRKWLDIGSASVKNLFVIGRDRLALWIVLMLTATPFHLMYNSIVFESLSTNEFGAVIGPKDLNPSNVWDLTTSTLESCFQCPAKDDYISSALQPLTWHEFASFIANESYYHISAAQCTQTTRTTQTGVRAIIALADNLTVSDGGNTSILLTGVANYWVEDTSDYWVQNKLRGSSFLNSTSGFGNASDCLHAGVINHKYNYYPTPDGLVSLYTITECLVIEAPEHCQLLYSPPICIAIMIAGAIKVTAMFLAARISQHRSPPLLTIGDAVASFMTRPDPTTKGMCWIQASDIKRGKWVSSSTPGSFSSIPQHNQDEEITYKRLSKHRFWMTASSGWRWAATLFMCLSCIITGAILFSASLGGAVDPSAGWFSWSQFKDWFSSDADITNIGLLGSGDLSRTMLSSVVVANVPQLIITMSYYCYNAVLTSMLAAGEYSSYGVKRKALRVTWPVKGSEQRSTYWLSVPYRYSAPILVIYMILHWLVSQSIFYLLLIPYDPHDNADQSDRISSLGYESMPIFFSIMVGVVMMLILFSLAFRRFKSVMPLAGSNSAVISAACHLPKDENLETAALRKVRWGQTLSPAPWAMGNLHGIQDQQGHCSFTSLDTVNPTLTKLYA